MGRVFVAGSISMDVVATAERHPRIGETVTGDAVLYFPGGKGANQAVAAAKLGAPTTLIGHLGKDAFGDELKAFLAAQGVDLSFVQQTSEAHTGTALITIANADNTIVVIPGANALVSAADVAAPAFAKVDILILNESELGLLANTEFCDTEDPARFIEAIRSLQTTGKTICVTMGKRGVLALIEGNPLIIPGHAVKAIDTTGAGDCFVGAVAAQLAGGKSIREALVYANSAASISVQRMGAAPSMPTAAEVEAVLSRPRERSGDAI